MGIVLTMIRVELSPKELNTFTDAMTTFTLCENQLRATVFNAGRFISQMRAQHGLGILETLCLGTGSLCAALFIPTMKGYERAILNYETDGIVSGFSVEACSEGWVRGYLREKHIPLTAPLESWDLAPFFGEGFVSVTKFKEGATEPMTGTVPITHKNIAQDVSEYFLQSEQTHTAIKTGIAFSRTGEVEAAGAFFIQVLPNASYENIQKVEQIFTDLDSPAHLCAQFRENAELIQTVFGSLDPRILSNRDVSFYCPCTRESLLAKLKLLKATDVESLDDPVEICCTNCSSRYIYSKSEIVSD